ncbi:helix-turn-helix transcriptional regulator [Sporosarcina sp. Te-1]|uniref:helix-turn-helix domain-containing protein n=1 Tax=Sporosarcina sp. Te-1 TaxID=2818390 RepID=UPI001A9FC303|nr:helix-turn-helix transcriptional regulator [Sporosarcina sp. Te-1]QTD41948.1 helix-turn-helix transcriptional regulator [Sporosarcina sp. Te-1]
MKKGWNQEEMAFRLNVNQSDISKYEYDHKEPLISIFHRWASVTNSQDVLVAYMAGVEGVTILANILATMGTGIMGFIRIGGFL